MLHVNFTVAVRTMLELQESSQLECTVSDNGNVSCTAMSDCDMELGVMCLEKNFVTRLVDQECTIASSATSEVEQPSSKMVGSCPIASLGGVIGLLVVVLTGLAIVLTVTCWMFGKRRSQKQQAE